jgi:hypothetical protein
VDTLGHGLLRGLLVDVGVVVRPARGGDVALEDTLGELVGDIRVGRDTLLEPQRTAPYSVVGELPLVDRADTLLKLRVGCEISSHSVILFR